MESSELKPKTSENKSMSPKRRYGMRAIALSKTDDQIAQLIPDNSLRERAQEEGLSLEKVMSIYLEGYADRPALGERIYDVVEDSSTHESVRQYKKTYKTISYREFHNRVKAIAMSWRLHPRCKVSPDEFVMIMGFADIDFASIDTACAFAKATTVPVQSSTSGADLYEMVANIEPAAIAATLADIKLAAQLALKEDSIKSIILFNYDDRVSAEKKIYQEVQALLTESGSNKYLVTIDELIEYGKKETYTYLSDSADELSKRAAIIHSSGSTGKPKGAVIERHVEVNNWIGKKTTLPRVTMHLAPLNHLMGRVNMISMMSCGGTGYFTLAPDLSTLLEDIRIARPTFVSLFPRIFELIYQHFQNEVAKRLRSSSEEKTVIEQGVMQEMRSSYLGDRLLCIVFGSAPTSAKVRAFMQECFDVLMIEGYGSTETGSNVTMEGRISRDNVIEYKLTDVPELGYYTTDKPFPRGELCIKTKFGIREYYKRPDVTKNLFDEEGYSRTGDIVEERAPDHVIIIDRRKDVLKLSQGEYVALGALGTNYEAGSPFIKQIYLYGNSQRSYLLATVVLEEELLYKELGDAPTETQIKMLLRQECSKVAQRDELKPFEIPRDFILEYEPFSQENGLLSSVRKRLRPALKRKYGDALESLYVIHETEGNDRILELRSHDSTLSTVEKLVILLEHQLGIEIPEPDQDHNFNAMGGDSMGASLFSLSIEEVFDVLLPADMLLSPDGNIQQWSKYIERLQDDGNSQQITFAEIHGKGAKVLKETDLILSKFIPTELLDNAAALPISAAVPKTVLMTGANGFLGHIVCLEWLKKLSLNGGVLICIIRASTDQAAFDKLSNEYSGLDSEFELTFKQLAKKHLKVLAGDISKPMFGLAEAEYHKLCHDVDRICHVAALVNHRLAYQHLFGPNVVGTAELIRLALSSTRKAIDFISTVGVFSCLETERGINERARLLEQVELSTEYASGYAQSKWAGELLLNKAHALYNIPVNVFRCDMILPDQKYNGQVNTSDMLTRLLYSIVQTGLAPQSFYAERKSGRRKTPHYDGVPVDLLAKAIVGVCEESTAGHNIYHALNYLDDTVSLDRFVDWIASAGYSINRFPDYKEWFKRIETKLKSFPEKKRKQSVLDLLMAFESPLYGGPSWVDCSNFKKLMSSLSFVNELSHLSEQYIHKYLEDLQLLGLIKKPKQTALTNSVRSNNMPSHITHVNAYAAKEAGASLEPYQYEVGELHPEQVDIKVHYCGLCHSDLSMIQNEWRNARYPLVPGHEIVGEVVAAGALVKNIKVGDKVGVGWLSESCMSCSQCMQGSQHLCRDTQTTISGTNGGFADYVRAHWAWAIPLPEGIDMSKAGPLLCGGITVFNPIIAAGVLPTHRVGVIGIGGLGHLALKFLKYWGCEVIAFSSTASKKEQILQMGASKVVNSRSREELSTVRGRLDFIINTTNVSLDWNSYIKALAPKGKFFTVGMVMEPMKVHSGLLMAGERTIGGSPVGSPDLVRQMLDFCVRHQIYPDVEEFPMTEVNAALAHLEAGKARYRIVLKA